MYKKLSFGFFQNMGAKLQDDVMAPTERTGTLLITFDLSVMQDVAVILHLILMIIRFHDR